LPARLHAPDTDTSITPHHISGIAPAATAAVCRPRLDPHARRWYLIGCLTRRHALPVGDSRLAESMTFENV